MKHTDLESRFSAAMKKGEKMDSSKTKALHKAKHSSKPNIVRVPKYAVDKTEETKN